MDFWIATKTKIRLTGNHEHEKNKEEEQEQQENVKIIEQKWLKAHIKQNLNY